MRKRPSRRRIKARLRLGQWVPMTVIVEWRLGDWGIYETNAHRFMRLLF